MLDEETYKKEIVRMWDTLRADENKGEGRCEGVYCGDCPLQDDFSNETCTDNINAFKVIKIVEKWSKEHPQKHKISQLEYDILEVYDEWKYLGNFFDHGLLMELLKRGYFKGAKNETGIEEYFDNCEVDND